MQHGLPRAPHASHGSIFLTVDSLSYIVTETRRIVEIRGLPKTALPSDVRRLCVGARVENIASGASLAPDSSQRVLIPLRDSCY